MCQDALTHAAVEREKALMCSRELGSPVEWGYNDVGVGTRKPGWAIGFDRWNLACRRAAPGRVAPDVAGYAYADNSASRTL